MKKKKLFAFVIVCSLLFAACIFIYQTNTTNETAVLETTEINEKDQLLEFKKYDAMIQDDERVLIAAANDGNNQKEQLKAIKSKILTRHQTELINGLNSIVLKEDASIEEQNTYQNLVNQINSHGAVSEFKEIQKAHKLLMELKEKFQ